MSVIHESPASSSAVVADNALARPLVVRGVTIPNRLFLAPVDGIFDYPARALAKRRGVGLTCSEMVPAQGLKFNRGKLLVKFDRSPDERPFQVQLSDQNPDLLARMAAGIEEHGYGELVDLNMGCPSRLVTASGHGAALLKDPALIREIVKSVRAAITLPLSIKIRLGWDAHSINALEVARIAEGEGADFITVHARTRAQAFGGNADWSMIAAVKQAVTIPVVGNGDVNSAESAQRMLRETACDAVMVARAAFGNPWLIERILSGDDTRRGSAAERRQEVFAHLALQFEWIKSERVAVRQMRKHLAWYVKSLPHAARFRREALIIPDRATLEAYLTTYFDELEAREAARHAETESTPST